MMLERRTDSMAIGDIKEDNIYERKNNFRTTFRSTTTFYKWTRFFKISTTLLLLNKSMVHITWITQYYFMLLAPSLSLFEITKKKKKKKKKKGTATAVASFTFSISDL